MSNLPPVISQPTDVLQRLMSEILVPRCHRRKDRASPYKPILLLPVPDCFGSFEYPENKNNLSRNLVSIFQYYFPRLHSRGDGLQTQSPFSHLRSEPFWHHRVREGRVVFYVTLNTSDGSTHGITEVIEHVYSSEYAYTVAIDPSGKHQPRVFLEELLWRERVDGRDG